MDVSIIIPTYNRLWSLPKAVDSCFETNLNIEVIVVDDGSSDLTSSWLENRKDIVAIYQENLGKDWAVNNAFNLAKGKYIRFLDSDDWHLPYSTDQLFKEAEKKNADVVAAGYEIYDEAESLLQQINWTVSDDFIAQQLGECDSSHYSAYLFKKSFIEDIPHRQEYGSRDDRKFIIEVSLKNPINTYIDTITFAHRIHSKKRLQKATGLISSFNNLAFLKIYQTTLSTLQSRAECSQRRKNAAVRMLWPLATWIAKESIPDAVQLIKWIKELDPNFRIKGRGVIGWSYQIIGFKATSYLLNFIRLFF